MRDSIESEKLLREFVSARSQGAFSGIVARHSGMVYATALRRVGGATGLAEEVTQEVFLLLAKKATRLPKTLCLGGWLYRQTCHLAANQRRSESRRQKRESMALEMMNEKTNSLPPEVLEELDHALLTLPEKTRDLLVMRFLEGDTYQRVGSHYNLSEEATRKQISRALERLRAVLAKRGLRTSSSLLATGMMLLSTGKMEAASQAVIVSKSMTAPSVKAGWVHQIGAFLLGAVGASSVAVGVLKYSSSYETPRSKTASSTVSEPRVVRRSASEPRVGALSSSDLITQIQRLDGGPQHTVTKIQLHALLEQISNHEIPDFVQSSLKHLTISSRKKCYKYLFFRWAKSEPGEAILAAIRGSASSHANLNTWLYRSLVSTWAYRDPEAVSAWLKEHWTKIEKMGPPQLMTPLLNDFLETSLDALESERGIEAALQQLKNHPPSLRYALLKNLTGDSLRTISKESAPSLYQYLKEEISSPEIDRIFKKFMTNWAAEDPRTMLVKLAEESPDDRFQAHLKLFGDIRPSGPEVEQGDGTITMMSHNRAYASLAGREKQAFDAGLAAGHSEESVRAQIAHAHLVEYSYRSSDFKWILENSGNLDIGELHDRVRKVTARLNAPRGLFTPAGPYHAAILNCLSLDPGASGEAVAGQLFTDFLSKDPERAKEFATSVALSAEQRVLFQNFIH